MSLDSGDTWNDSEDNESFEDYLQKDNVNEEELMYGAFVNTYLVFTKQYTVEKIIEARGKRGEDNIGFLFSPDQDNIFHDKTNLICDMIDYFVEHEEYEKGSQLKKLL